MLSPRAPHEWPDMLANMQDSFAARLNVYHMMAHHPALLQAWAPLRDHVVMKNALGPEFSEVTILRTGHNLGAAYEWDHHVSRARAIGMSDARIASLRLDPSDMAPDDAIIATAVDALFIEKRLPPETANALSALVGTEGVFDVIATVGFYSTLGYLVNSFDVPVDTDVARELADKPLAP